MAKATHPIPAEYRGVMPYLIVRGASDAMRFYQRAFGAVVPKPPMLAPDGQIMHGEMTIGGGTIMIADEYPEMGYTSPQTVGGTAVSLLLYVADVDALFQRAVGAGARVVTAPEDRFYGDRIATIADPYGHLWILATHIEDVTAEEIQLRLHARFGGEQARHG